MVLPEPSTAIEVEIKGEPRNDIASNPGAFLSNAAPFLSTAAPFLSAAAALFLGVGSVYQLFREGGFSLSWFADGARLESAIALFYSSPVLSVALVLVGLVYCLAREPNETQERE
jgi:NADH:ubiquinone oxidoreductase subunit 6 (subunit J)